MKEDIYLSVIIPAYNEEKRIPKTLKIISSYLEKQPYPYEILVVNDGSRDQTAEVVNDLCQQVKNCFLIDRKKNMGKGYSVCEGMLKAQGRIRLFTDADNSTDISHFEKMRPFFDKGYEIVIGSRDSKDASTATQAVPQPWIKRMMGNMGNLFIQIVAVHGIWDTQAGFKAFRNFAAEEIFSKARINRWAFDIEALALAKHFGYKIGIIPLNWVNDPNTHVSFMGYIKTLIDTIRIRWNFMRKKYH